MKQGIHPKYFDEAKISCACGNTFTVASTLSEIHLDVCSKCHPFFTGEMKYVDTLGMVEKFQKAQEKAKTVNLKKQQVEKEKEEKKRPTSLREMLELAKKQATS